MQAWRLEEYKSEGFGQTDMKKVFPFQTFRVLSESRWINIEINLMRQIQKGNLGVLHA